MQITGDFKIKIPREEVLRILKHDKKSNVFDEKISDLIDNLIKEGKKLAEPKAVYKDFWIKGSTEHTIVLQDAGYDLVGAKIVHHLWNCEAVTLFAVTIGPKLEERIKELTDKNNIADAVILDAAGSVAVESVTDDINEIVNKNAAEKGYKTVKRFSPGYGDWELKEQKGLLNTVNASQIGIALSSGFQMIPQKSISGVIGWVK